jgi:glycosyltransferase involved in cell wall biosynthesis
MAQGTPVVAIAELGTASILIEGQGALIAPDNIEGFAEKVHHLLQHPQNRYELGKSALKYAAEKWTAKLQAVRMLHFYHHIKSVHQANDEKAPIKMTFAESKQANVEF